METYKAIDVPTVNRCYRFQKIFSQTKNNGTEWNQHLRILSHKTSKMHQKVKGKTIYMYN